MSKNSYTIALAGNPNVGKSTIFNNLTGMHQHTGNWTGKTVANAVGNAKIKDIEFTFVDIPGTYSIIANSPEEKIARDFICSEKADATVVVVDSTMLERNLNLAFQIMEITDNVILCVNLLDEAKKKHIKIDLKKLEKLLGIPVVGTTAQKKKTLENLKDTIYDVCCGKIKCSPIKLFSEQKSEIIETSNKEHIEINNKDNNVNNLSGEAEVTKISDEEKVSIIMKKAEEITKEVCTYENKNYTSRDRKIDKILTSKTFGIPIMILFLAIIFWITIVGANYPSNLLFEMFKWIQGKLIIFANYIHLPEWLSNMIIYGVYQTLTWIISVMLPPMAIFFPLFTILEDLGYLPRIAFNMDGFFKKACCSGKQMITMCMGFGCNACGVTGCRIIESPREKLIAIITNNLVPCNGRFPLLITIATIFISGAYAGKNKLLGSMLSTFSVIIIILLGIILTLVISNILSKTILKGMPSSMVLELPPYRKPQFGKIILRSIFDRTLFVLGRAVSVAAPAGLVIWIFANVSFSGSSLLSYIAGFLNPFAKLMGLDGYILTAFILGMPANEIVLPIILMCYLKGNSLVNIEDTTSIGKILIDNGWNMLTAMNVMLFTLFHFPCTTTLLTIKKETGSLKWTFASFLIPTICGILLCMSTTFIYKILL